MTRLRRLRPDELDDAQHAVYAAVTTGRRAGGPQLFRLTDVDGGLLGPFNALLAQPGVGMAVQRLGEVLRYETALPADVREAVILRVAADRRSEFEWYAHEPLARAADLPDAAVEALRRGTAVPARAEVAAALALADRLLGHDRVDAGTYVAAEAAFGAAGLVEIAALVGYYRLLAGLLATFDVAAPDDSPSAFDGG